MLHRTITERKSVLSVYMFTFESAVWSCYLQFTPAKEHDYVRNYSLSGRPGEDFYRISVKREDEHDKSPAGTVSNFIHANMDIGSEILVTNNNLINFSETKSLKPFERFLYDEGCHRHLKKKEGIQSILFLKDSGFPFSRFVQLPDKIGRFRKTF
jgi:hypothetical protein